jgi:hypothetical protein
MGRSRRTGRQKSSTRWWTQSQLIQAPWHRHDEQVQLSYQAVRLFAPRFGVLFCSEKHSPEGKN